MTKKQNFPLKTLLVAGLAIALYGCSEKAEEAGEAGMTAVSDEPVVEEVAVVENDNPFFTEWDTPYGIPPFDQIRDEHYKPAFEAGIEQQRIDVAAIRDNPEAPTFENTIEALQLAGKELNRVSLVFGNITNTDTNDSLQELEVEIYPILTGEEDAKYLDQAIFERVQAVYAARESLELDEQAMRLLELTHRDFVRKGAALDDEAKVRLKEINARVSELNTMFAQNLLKETKAFELVIIDQADLSGLSPSMIGSARAKAESKGKPDAWVFGLDRGTYEGFMTFADNRELRRQMFNAYRARGAQGNENDNRDILVETANLRAERAVLLGYSNHSEYQLETRMAKTPEKVESFLLEVWKPGLQKANEELAEMQLIVQEEGNDFIIEGHDWWYYAEKLRGKKYAMDEAEIKPYFELNNVREGAFHVANQLFGVTFEPLQDVPVWNEVVQPYTVHDADGEFLGVFMLDYYARDSKRGGAWMSSYRQTSNMRGKSVRPIITNNLNVAVPAEGEDTLLSYDQVETLFHEFGHGLHGLLTQVRYPRFAGTSGSPRDYTEFPAQFMEHYASQPQVLAVYAKHAETGEVIPQELVDKIRAASTHNQGFKTTEYIAASLLDLSWHKLTPGEAAAVEDATSFEGDMLTGFGKPGEIETRYRSPYFAHIFAGGYSAGYYAYLWSEILDADGFTAFKESGNIYDPELAARLKENIYQAGGLRDADVLYREFRGKDPSIGPLLEIRGLN
ncbi:MAG: M3 family metallopeptidase [Xanthomonadales bacterium]|jgi:peptidyl-dipeptidase Dcp|nr:M3 family metallopeptidase [Xanthomonadales bacterium]MDH3939633.1 M3 family metallopeptidase [Xanthomonadales bacterium]MDH4002145.1 M3 family metallopeptidase [Xanthomonadales bacterium]